jgi:drug/metabolite transporter (DMT)-like permease
VSDARVERLLGGGPISLRANRYLCYVALAAGILCIGSSAIFVRWAGLPGPVTAFYRFFIAALAVTPMWLARHRERVSRRDIALIVAGGACFALDVALWNASLLRIPAATSTLLTNSAPLWIGLAGLLFFSERLPAKFWGGLALALGGMACLVGPSAWARLSFDPGVFMAVGSSVLYATYLLLTRRVRARVGTVAFMGISVLTAAAVMLAVSLALGLPLAGFPARVWLCLGVLGFVGHLSGWLCINYALGHLPAGPVSVSLLGQAVVTALLAIPLLGEGLNVYQIAGGSLVLAGIYLANQRRR